MVGVLDETVFYLGLLSKVPQRDGLEELSAEFDARKDASLVECLNQLRVAEKRLLKAGRGSSKDQITTAALGVHEATRQVCRVLRNDSRAIEALSAWHGSHTESWRVEGREREDGAPAGKSGSGGSSSSNQERHESKDEEKVAGDGDAEQELESSLSDMLGIVSSFKTSVVERMSTSLEQAQAKSELLGDLKSRIKQEEEDLEVLKAELAKEADKRAELERKKDHIGKLTAAIQEVRYANDKEAGDIARHMSDKLQGLRVSSGDRSHKALDLFDKASGDFVKSCEAGAELEDQLRKRLNRGMAEVIAAIARYDDEMLSKRDLFDRLRRQHAEESARLAVLSEHFRKVDRDLTNEAEEERLIEAERAEVRAKEKYRHDKAAMIQALFRGSQTRKALKKKKKGKGKAGAKGKAGGKAGGKAKKR